MSENTKPFMRLVTPAEHEIYAIGPLGDRVPHYSRKTADSQDGPFLDDGVERAFVETVWSGINHFYGVYKKHYDSGEWSTGTTIYANRLEMDNTPAVSTFTNKYPRPPESA